jgi:hypothetical protein
MPARLRRDVVVPVGLSYLTARSAATEPLVLAAYDRLRVETDRLFEALTACQSSGRIRVAFTRCRQPYASDLEMIVAAREAGILEVTTAAASRERLHPLLGCEFAGPFDRFRAVHDLLGHVKTGFGFDLGEELAAWLAQESRHSELAKRALATELLAINSARSLVGEAPWHKAVLLDGSLVQRARSLIAGRVPASSESGIWRVDTDPAGVCRQFRDRDPDPIVI